MQKTQVEQSSSQHLRQACHRSLRYCCIDLARMGKAKSRNFSKPFPMNFTAESKNLGISPQGRKALKNSGEGIHWSSPYLLIKGESWQGRAERTATPIPWHKLAHPSMDWNDLGLRALVRKPCKGCCTEIIVPKSSMVEYCHSCLFRARKCISCNGFLGAQEYLHCRKCVYHHSGPIPVLRCNRCGKHKPELASARLCNIDGRVYSCCNCFDRTCLMSI